MRVRSTARRPLDADERGMLDELVRDMGPRLLAYVRRAYGRAFEPEEIVAETFCRAAANIEALRKAERPDLYLLTIARNLCRDGFRRPGPETMPDERLQGMPGGEPEPRESVAQEEQKQALQAEVEALPDAQREIVILRLSAGLKFEQIAELLNIPLGTALSRMHAAVHRLKSRLGCVHER